MFESKFLQNDKSKCTGLNCSKKEKCLRYIGEHEKHEQSSILSPLSCMKAIVEQDEIIGWEYKMFLEIVNE